MKSGDGYAMELESRIYSHKDTKPQSFLFLAVWIRYTALGVPVQLGMIYRGEF